MKGIKIVHQIAYRTVVTHTNIIDISYANRASEVHQMCWSQSPSNCTTFPSVYDGWLARSEACQMYGWRLVRVKRVIDTAVLDTVHCPRALTWNLRFCRPLFCTHTQGRLLFIALSLGWPTKQATQPMVIELNAPLFKQHKLCLITSENKIRNKLRANNQFQYTKLISGRLLSSGL
jgi:hypothetical protein